MFKSYRQLNQQMSPLSFSAANLNTISGDMSNIVVEVGHWSLYGRVSMPSVKKTSCN